MTANDALEVAKVRARLAGVHPDQIQMVCDNKNRYMAMFLLIHLADHWEEFDEPLREAWSSPIPERRR